jgi:putative Holliday junction resolvase
VKYLGIDFGTKRIGLALSDESGTLAFPHSTLASNAGSLAAIDELVKKETVGAVVLGESRDFSGQANDVQEDIEQFKKDLEVLTNLPVYFESEVFSSALAARQFAPEEKSRKQNPAHTDLDASAAALILQSYLDRMKRNGN